VRSLTVSLLMGLILSMGSFDSATTLAASDQPTVSQPGSTEDVPLPVYTPPKKLTPRARLGGGLRGADGNDPGIVPLVPDHVALTAKESPVLNWFISKPTTYPLMFTLIDISVITPLHEGLLPAPDHQGVYAINLKDWGLALDPDVQYRWYISAIRNPDSPSTNIVVGGMIERCEFSACLVPGEVDVTCNLQSVRWNSARGFWYDAMACLCELIDSNPSDPVLRRQRASLLNQAGLPEVAKWDLASIQAPVR
jgi:hypothetical protein